MTARELRLSIAACAVFVSAGACAADATVGQAARADALSRHGREVAVCNSGRSNQDRATCLREADAALMEARRGGLGNGSDPYERNQAIRCSPLPPSQRADCLARMQGQGSTSGSVAAGGLYRELVTRDDPAVAPAPAIDPKPEATVPQR